VLKLRTMGVEIGPQSEDCLYINVWTKPQTGEKKKAVMVRCSEVNMARSA
jgi:carboxylesterase type B